MKKLISVTLSLLALGLFVQPAQAAISPVSNITVQSSNTTPGATTDLTISFTLDQSISADEAILFAVTSDQDPESASASGFDLSTNTNLISDFSGDEFDPFGVGSPFYYFDLSAGATSGNYEVTLEGAVNSNTPGCYYGMMLTDPNPGDSTIYYSAETTFTVGDVEGCDDQVVEPAEITQLDSIVVGNVARLNWTLPELSGDVDHYDVYVGVSDIAVQEAMHSDDMEPNVAGLAADITTVDLSKLAVNTSQVIGIVAVAADNSVLAYGMETVVTGEKGFIKMKAPQPTIAAKSVRARQLRVNKLNHRGLVPTSKLVQISTSGSNKVLVKKANVLNGADVTKLVKKLPKRFAGQEVVARQRIIMEGVYNVETGLQETVKSDWSKYSAPRTLLPL